MEWGLLRAALGKPRRFSLTFLRQVRLMCPSKETHVSSRCSSANCLTHSVQKASQLLSCIQALAASAGGL